MLSRLQSIPRLTKFLDWTTTDSHVFYVLFVVHKPPLWISHHRATCLTSEFANTYEKTEESA